MTANFSAGTTVDIAEVTIGGLGITSVQTSNQSSGTLALRNNITVTTEKLDIAGRTQLPGVLGETNSPAPGR